MIRILRPTDRGGLISGQLFDDSFTRNLYPEVSVREVALAQWLGSLFSGEMIRPDEKAVHEMFRSATAGFDFLCPNYIGIPLTPLLLYLRNRSAAPIRLLLIAHAPGVYGLEWALLRPLLRSGDVIIAPTHSARDVIDFLSPELAAYTRVAPHPMRPLPFYRTSRRTHIVSLTRLQPSKLLHRQIEAMALLGKRGYRDASMRIAGPTRSSLALDTAAYAQCLLAKIARLGLDDSVELVGEITGPQNKSRFLSEARLLVNLSVTTEESFGKSIAEALGAGVPVVATHWNGFPEIIGAGGSCVPVEGSMLGMDVPAEHIADAIQSVLEAPPGRDVCRHEALRFHPRRVRRLYRQELEAAMDATAANLANGDIPAPGEPAAPAAGLLANTAPLMHMSWQNLFSIHLTDVTRIRASLAGVVHRTAREADELRSLLISGVRAPLSRRMAGLELNGMDQPVGIDYPGNSSSSFSVNVSRGAMSRATLSSRLACMSLVAHAGKLKPLQRVVKAMHTDGIQSWGLEHLEIEALRLGGQYEHAFLLSTGRVDPLYWGELAAERLRQLAAVCREWGRPEIALPWLRQWLEHFPDSPDSGAVHLDMCVNALAAGAAFVSEARQALQSARCLLGESVELAALENSVQRVEALKEKLPWRTLEEQVGMISAIRLIGRSAFVVDAAAGRFVLKQIRDNRDPGRYLDMLAALARIRPHFCPRPLMVLDAGDIGWYALFEWVDGQCPASTTLNDAAWGSVVNLLQTLASCSIVPEWQLESMWLDRLEQHFSDHPAAAFIMNLLRSAMPEGESTLAHGDFSPQNFVWGSGGLVLVDWDEIGSAPPGFDAGWMLAHAYLGVGARPYVEMIRVLMAEGFQKSNLRWFERLGLLRLLFRARTLPMDDGRRQRVQTAVNQAVYQCAATMGWHGDSSLDTA